MTDDDDVLFADEYDNHVAELEPQFTNAIAREVAADIRECMGGEMVTIRQVTAIGAIAGLRRLARIFSRVTDAPEHPDDSGEYDDETLIEIIAERFECDKDEITRRDGLWISNLALRFVRITNERRPDDVSFQSCICRATDCVCVRLVPRGEIDAHGALCADCRAGAHELLGEVSA